MPRLFSDDVFRVFCLFNSAFDANLFIHPFVFVFMGPVACGKSFLAQKFMDLSNNRRLCLISSDSVRQRLLQSNNGIPSYDSSGRFDQSFRDLVKEEMIEEIIIIINSGFCPVIQTSLCSVIERRRFFSKLSACLSHATILLIQVSASLDSCIKRALSRTPEFGETRNVDIVKKYHDSFQPISESEFQSFSNLDFKTISILND